MIFDTHAHYDDKKFDEDREELISSLPDNGVGLVVNVSASLSSVKASLELAERYPYVYSSVGIHPDEVGELDEEKLDYLRVMAGHSKCAAIGEIGLDYYWNKEDKAIQEKWFVSQINLARELGKPIIVHSREAAKDTFEILCREHAEDIGGVIHCYSYSWEMAKEYLKRGYYLGIGGVVTFSNAQKLKEVVVNAPLSQLVLETDCPYLAPAPNRGKRNSSLFLPFVVKTIAELKGVSEEEVLDVTWKNGLRLYGLEDRLYK